MSETFSLVEGPKKALLIANKSGCCPCDPSCVEFGKNKPSVRWHLEYVHEAKRLVEPYKKEYEPQKPTPCWHEALYQQPYSAVKQVGGGCGMRCRLALTGTKAPKIITKYNLTICSLSSWVGDWLSKSSIAVAYENMRCGLKTCSAAVGGPWKSLKSQKTICATGGVVAGKGVYKLINIDWNNHATLSLSVPMESCLLAESVEIFRLFIGWVCWEL